MNIRIKFIICIVRVYESNSLGDLLGACTYRLRSRRLLTELDASNIRLYSASTDEW